nr:hypothetical protein [Streptomyces sp. NK08204]
MAGTEGGVVPVVTGDDEAVIGRVEEGDEFARSRIDLFQDGAVARGVPPASGRVRLLEVGDGQVSPVASRVRATTSAVATPGPRSAAAVAG